MLGTPPENSNSWATSAGATLDGTFASGLDIDGQLHVEHFLPKNTEARQLQEAQALKYAAILPKPKGGGARGRDMNTRNTQSVRSQPHDGQNIEIADDGADVEVKVGKQPSQHIQGPVLRRHRQT